MACLPTALLAEEGVAPIGRQINSLRQSIGRRWQSRVQPSSHATRRASPDVDGHLPGGEGGSQDAG